MEKLGAQGPDAERIREAYAFASAAHEGQVRKDGTPYITHPLAVAEIIAEMGLDIDSVIAAILHDVLEDTEVPYDDIKKKFGSAVADLVDGVTKLKSQYTSKRKNRWKTSARCLPRDIQVILIKIADRLLTCTIAYQDDRKRRERPSARWRYMPRSRTGSGCVYQYDEDLALEYLDDRLQ